MHFRLRPGSGGDPASEPQPGGTWAITISAPYERYLTFSARDQVVLVAELTEHADVAIQGGGAVEVVLRGRLLAAGDPAWATARDKPWGVLTAYPRRRAPAIADPLAARRV